MPKLITTSGHMSQALAQRIESGEKISGCISTSEGKCFVKIGTGGISAPVEALKCEKLGCNLLSEAFGRFTPGKVCCPKGLEVTKNGAIVLENIDFLSNNKIENAAGKLGEGLAAMHRGTAEAKDSPVFGFPMDGQCGQFPQLNNVERRDITWLDFWREFRLRPQAEGLKRLPARSTSSILEQLQQLDARLPEFFSDLIIEDIGKSLLHGDLWSGNWGVCSSPSSTPQLVIFDPASYYGHGEADLGAVSFSGSNHTIATYQTTLHNQTQAAHFAKRLAIYRLQHELNHANIFGVGYLRSVASTLAAILA